jgi:hypothetical protein
MRPRDTSSVLKIIPRDQETDVPRDATLLVTASRALDQHATDGVRVMSETGCIEGVAHLSSDGRILFWRPLEALEPQSAHRVTVSGVRDERGALFDEHSSTFVTGIFSYRDLELSME